MGVVAISGLDPPSSAEPSAHSAAAGRPAGPQATLAGGGASGASISGTSSSTDPVTALQPFLHEHAAHFWHELR